MSNLFIGLGAFNAFIAVGFGAFAAHKLKEILADDRLAVIQTAAEYQFYHALGLILVGLLLQRGDTRCNRRAGWFMLVGIILFCGSLYLLGLTGARWLGMITPVGGVSFLTAWFILTLAHLWPQEDQQGENHNGDHISPGGH